MEKVSSLTQSVNAVPACGVWDIIFHSEEVAANAEKYKKSVEAQVTELKRWSVRLENVYCKHRSSSSHYCKATERLTCRIWRTYSTHDLY
jgi:hypothetical protein